MRAVIQRVRSASVQINQGEVRSIGPGLVIFLGVGDRDTLDIVPKLAEKCAGLRIFVDEQGKMSRSAVDCGYGALVISNFTLHASTKKGKRPSFAHAANPEFAKQAYDLFVQQMEQQGLAELQQGEFGADMQVQLHNDGPVTIIVDTDEW